MMQPTDFHVAVSLVHAIAGAMQAHAVVLVAIYENEIQGVDLSEDGVSSAQCDAARHQEEMLRLSKLIAAPAAKQGGPTVSDPE